MPCSYYIEEEMKKENYDDNENLMSAEGFLDFLQKNRRTVPNEKRLANKEKFIWAVRELSEAYEIDADLIEDDDGYTASLFMNYHASAFAAFVDALGTSGWWFRCRRW